MKLVSYPGLTKEAMEELLRASLGLQPWNTRITHALYQIDNWYRDDEGYWHMPDDDEQYTVCLHKEVIDTGFGPVYCKHCHLKGYRQQGEIKWETAK